MSLLPWQTAVVKAVKDHNSHTRSFFLAVDGVDVFDFKPGQFVTFDLPIAERPSQRMRSYSIASAPQGNNVFELVVSHKPGGAGSGYFFEQCVEGHQVKFRGPAGTFVLPEVIERPMVLVCTGTGVAPFRSQILHLLNQHIATPDIHLVFGTRTAQDILYYEEFRAMTEAHAHFHYYVALSRADQSWTGRRGYVHEIYTELSNIGTADLDFYLCGWRLMVNDARKHLQELGYAREHVHLEVYD